MTETYEVWQQKVEDALRSINMSMSDWRATGRSISGLSTMLAPRPTTPL
jgi:hypothetical protein